MIVIFPGPTINHITQSNPHEAKNRSTHTKFDTIPIPIRETSIRGNTYRIMGEKKQHKNKNRFVSEQVAAVCSKKKKEYCRNIRQINKNEIPLLILVKKLDGSFVFW